MRNMATQVSWAFVAVCLATVSLCSCSSFVLPRAPVVRLVKKCSTAGVGCLFANIEPSVGAVALKDTLLAKVDKLRELKDRDGDFSVDFGVKGGELNETTRAPQKVNYYSISEEVGAAADEIMEICDSLSQLSPVDEPTKFLGDKKNGAEAPLNGAWKLLFTTAADASFSKNSTRGDAKVQNVVDAERGRITNVIDFSPSDDGKGPPLKQLNVVIKAKPVSKDRVELRFKYAKVVLKKFPWRLYIPVPAPFITRLIVFFSRIVKFGKGGKQRVPKAYFDVLYLDDDLRIHKTGDDNLFVQAKESWEAARPLLE